MNKVQGKGKKTITKTEVIETDADETEAVEIQQTRVIQDQKRRPVLGNPLEYEYHFDKFLQSVGVDVSDTTLSVYRRSGSGQSTKFAAVNRWQGEIPSYEDISMIVGPGHFKFVLFVKRPGMEPIQETVEFAIENSVYLQKQREQAGYFTMKETPGPVTALNQTGDMFSMFEKFMSILSPIIQKNITPAAPAKDDFSVMKEAGRAMSEMMKDNLKSQFDIMRDFSKKAAGFPMLTSGETEKEEIEETTKAGSGIMDTIEKFLPMIEKYLPVLLGKGPASEMIVDAVKAAPDFKTLISDRTSLLSFVKGVEEKIGPEQTRGLMEKFGLNV